MNTATMVPLLEAKSVTKYFGGVKALDDVSFRLVAGTRVGLIGPNGAGKTTLLNALSRLIEIDGGDLFVRGASYRHTKPDHLRRLGIARSFQHVRNWQNLSVRDNLLVGRTASWQETLWASLFRRSSIATAENNLWDSVRSYLSEFEIEDEEMITNQLSLGQQRVLELIRIFIADVDVFLLDEPSVGLASHAIKRLSDHLVRLKKQGKAILIVSHDLTFLRENSDLLIAMSSGRILAYGDLEEVIGEQQVRDAYVEGS